MNQSTEEGPCISNRIASYLADQLDASERRAFESHLEHCVRCRTALSDGAADPPFWNDVADLLPQDDLDRKTNGVTASAAVVSDFDDAAAESSRGMRSETARLIREVSGWLDPTDDPRMLGRFAGYEIAGIIGHGGMGIVLKGREPSLDRYVAIKILAPRLACNEIARKRFAREARAAASIVHPNVIAIHRVDQFHGLPYLVMPYLAGESLQQRIDRAGPLPCDAALRVASQLAAGLSAAHEKGTVHRDVKPANILLHPGVERVTITDFGLAHIGDDGSVTRTGMLPGTPSYMSPEQASGFNVDASSDLYSLGSVLFAMATGRPPFSGDSGQQIVNHVRSSPPIEFDAACLGYPAWYGTLVKRLMSKAPSDRPEKALRVHEIADACLRHLEDESQPLPEELCHSASRSFRKGLMLAGVLLLAIPAAVTLMLANPLTNAARQSRPGQPSGIQHTPAPEVMHPRSIDQDFRQIDSDINAIKEALDEIDS